MAPVSSGVPTFAEKHYTPKEIAALWSVHENSVRRLFIDEEGVLKLGALNKRKARSYVTLRIPAHVVDRVYRQRTQQ